MKNSVLLVCLCLVLNSDGLTDFNLVSNALSRTIQRGCAADQNTALSIPGWGVPDELFHETGFTNLVAVMSANINDCDVDYVNSLTGEVERAVFIAALTKCGPNIYKSSIVRWFGGLTPQATSGELIGSFISPIGTDMEDYVYMNYDAPGISNVLLNAKSLYTAASNDVAASALDSILSGEVKKNKLFLRDNGLIDRIRDGSRTNP